jgi:hypothetical protein
MLRRLALLLLLLAAGWLGCSKSRDSHSESIPKIPPGRSRVGPDQGSQVPVAPPAKKGMDRRAQANP